MLWTGSTLPFSCSRYERYDRQRPKATTSETLSSSITRMREQLCIAPHGPTLLSSRHPDTAVFEALEEIVTSPLKKRACPKHQVKRWRPWAQYLASPPWAISRRSIHSELASEIAAAFELAKQHFNEFPTSLRPGYIHLDFPVA